MAPHAKAARTQISRDWRDTKRLIERSENGNAKAIKKAERKVKRSAAENWFFALWTKAIMRAVKSPVISAKNIPNV